MARWKSIEVLLLAVALASCGRDDKDAGRSAAEGPASGAATPAAGGAEAFWNAWRAAVASGDGRALWHMTSASNRQAILERTRRSMTSMPDSEWKVLAALTRQEESRLRAMPPEMLAEETTVAMLNRLRDQPGELEKAQKSEFVSADLDGDRAVIRFRLADRRELSLVAVKEEGSWKADLEATARSGGKK